MGRVNRLTRDDVGEDWSQDWNVNEKGFSILVIDGETYRDRYDLFDTRTFNSGFLRAT